MSKSVKRGIILVVLLIIVLMIVLPRMDFLKADNKDKKSQATAQAPGARGGGPPNVAVDVMLVKTEKLDNKIQSTGTIMANEEVELRSEVSGKISRILFKARYWCASMTMNCRPSCRG
jgi:membrane fusion protein (multidrug efflux system)